MKFNLPNGEELEICEFEIEAHRHLGAERRFGVKYKEHMRFHVERHEEAVGLALVAQWMAKILHEESCTVTKQTTDSKP